MTIEKRTPGRVDDEARPFNAPGPEEDNQNRKRSDQDANRRPGRVTEETELVQDTAGSGGESETGVLPGMSEGSPWKIFFILLVCTFSIWLLSETAMTLISAYREQIVWVWVPLTVVTTGLLATLAWGVWREIKAIRGIDHLAEREQQIRAMLRDRNLPGLQKVLEPTLENLRSRHPGLIREFELAARERETTDSYLSQFDNIVLCRLDQEVKMAIRRGMITGSAAVAISPHPALDSFLILWRAKVLVRTIGKIYGLQPTGLSSVRLLKHVVTTAMIAATLETTGEMTLTQAAQDMALKAFKPVAEGATAALRMYRLGKITQQVCRPVPKLKNQGGNIWAEDGA